MPWRERDLLAAFARKTPPGPAVAVGPGDDCAVVSVPPSLVLTTDLMAEGTDFLPSHSLRSVGWKSVMISASDIAAMGASPLFFLVAAQLPPGMEEGGVLELIAGMEAAAESVGASLVGGDLSAGPSLLLVSTGAGAPPPGGPVLRSTARAGDLVFVTGPLGGSILGRHLTFRARVEEGRFLAPFASAMMDISDGLSGDLVHIADASSLDFTVSAASVPVHPDAVALSERTGRSPLHHALHDGEDFELLFTLPPDRLDDFLSASRDAGFAFHRIGRMTPKGSGRFLETDEGPRPWRILSHEHRG